MGAENPMICFLQSEDSGGVVSRRPKTWEPEYLTMQIPVQGKEKMKWDVPGQIVRQQKGGKF